MSGNVLVYKTTFCYEDNSISVPGQFVVDKDALCKIKEDEKAFLRESFNVKPEDEPTDLRGRKTKKVDVFFYYKDVNGDPVDHFNILPSAINVDVVPFEEGGRSLLKMSLSKENIDEATVMAARSGMINTIFNEVCKYFNVNKEDVVSGKRLRKLIIPKQFIVFFIHRYREIYKMSLNDIAQLFNQNHSTMLYSVKEIGDKSEVEAETKVARNHFQVLFDKKFRFFE